MECLVEGERKKEKRGKRKEERGKRKEKRKMIKKHVSEMLSEMFSCFSVFQGGSGIVKTITKEITHLAPLSTGVGMW